MNYDLSSLWRMITSTFATNYPMRLAIGVALACFVQTVVHVLARTFPDDPALQALDEFATIWYLIIFTPLMYLPVILGKEGAPESVVTQINTIKALISEGDFGTVQRIMIWRSLTDKYLAALQPDLSRPPKLRDLYHEAANEIHPDPPQSA